MSFSPGPERLPVPVHFQIVQIEDARIAAIAAARVEIGLGRRLRHGVRREVSGGIQDREGRGRRAHDSIVPKQSEGRLQRGRPPQADQGWTVTHQPASVRSVVMLTGRNFSIVSALVVACSVNSVAV